MTTPAAIKAISEAHSATTRAAGVSTPDDRKARYEATYAAVKPVIAAIPDHIRAGVLFDLLKPELDGDLQNALRDIRGVYSWRGLDNEMFYFHADELMRVATAIFHEAEDAE